MLEFTFKMQLVFFLLLLSNIKMRVFINVVINRSFLPIRNFSLLSFGEEAEEEEEMVTQVSQVSFHISIR